MIYQLQEIHLIQNFLKMGLGSVYLLFLLGVIIWLLTFIPKCLSICCKSCKKIQQDAVDEVYENTV